MRVECDLCRGASTRARVAVHAFAFVRVLIGPLLWLLRIPTVQMLYNRLQVSLGWCNKLSGSKQRPTHGSWSLYVDKEKLSRYVLLLVCGTCTPCSRYHFPVHCCRLETKPNYNNRTTTITKLLYCSCAPRCHDYLLMYLRVLIEGPKNPHLGRPTRFVFLCSKALAKTFLARTRLSLRGGGCVAVWVAGEKV